MTDQSTVQISTPIRNGDAPLVVVRINDSDDVDIAAHLLNEATERLAPLVKGAVQALSDVPPDMAAAVQNLQQAGLNPQVISQQAPPAAPSAAQCPACSKPTACNQCQSATRHTTKYSQNKGQNYNVHECTSNPRHINWCKTPIPMALQGIVGNPNLVYG